MQLFPERVQKLWNEWELRVLVLLSLSLQVVLIILGNRRKHAFGPWVRIMVWSAYMSADWVAAVSIGILANSRGDSDNKSIDPNRSLNAFWASFLIVHLGGPDTITAYSLEDNELWLRHLLGLVVHVGLAFYVIIRSWAGTQLNFLSILMFVAGIIKYGERTWVLRSSSKNNFRDSLLPAPDPGPDFVVGRRNISLKERIQIEEARKRKISKKPLQSPVDDDITAASGNYITQAYFLFENQFKRLYADLNLSPDDKKNSSRIITNIKSGEAFKLVEMELSFLYDVLYTKATLVHSLAGIILRCTTFFSTFAGLVVFHFFINKHVFSKVDISITYTLLLGAFCLEIYAIVMLIFSDWSIVWLKKKESSMGPVVTSFLLDTMKERRWSRCMAQKNLIEYCLRNKSKYFEVPWFLDQNKLLEQYWYMSGEEVDDEMKKPILNYLLKITADASSDFKALLQHRGDYVITKMGLKEELGWSIGGVEFDQSILLWHIATDLYHVSDEEPDNEWRRISKRLSQYMFYLLVMCPFMMPKWIGIEECRFRDTCEEAKRLFQEKGIPKYDSDGARRLLLNVNTDVEVDVQVVRRDHGSKSVLFDACRIAKKLKSWDAWGQAKWETISEVWVEMLCYAASHCEWTQHGHQLRRGGELLTHVYLIMSHLGLTQQLQLFEDQFQDARVVASRAARAAADCVQEAADTARREAKHLIIVYREIVPDATIADEITNHAQAASSHADIVAAYAYAVADAAGDAARAVTRMVDSGAFYDAGRAVDAVTNAVAALAHALPTDDSRELYVSLQMATTAVADAARAARKTAAIAVAQIQITKDPNQDRRHPASEAARIAANDAHEAAYAAHIAATRIRDVLANTMVANTIADHADDAATRAEAVVAHASAAANACRNDAPADELHRVAKAAHAVRDDLDAIAKATAAVAAIAINTTDDYYQEVHAAAARVDNAAGLAGKAAAIAIAIAISQTQDPNQDPLIAAAYAARIAAYDVREAAFAVRIAVYNVLQVSDGEGRAEEIARLANDAVMIASDVAAYADASADAMGHAATNAARHIGDLNFYAYDIAALAHHSPTNTTGEYYHRVNIAVARLVEAAYAAEKAAAAAIAPFITVQGAYQIPHLT